MEKKVDEVKSTSAGTLNVFLAGVVVGLVTALALAGRSR